MLLGLAALALLMAAPTTCHAQRLSISCSVIVHETRVNPDPWMVPKERTRAVRHSIGLPQHSVTCDTCYQMARIRALRTTPAGWRITRIHRVWPCHTEWLH